MQVVDSVSGSCLGEVATASVVPGSVIMTDGWGAYRKLPALGYIHEPVAQEDTESAPELLPWVHVVISNFKRWVLDVFHGVSSKHLQSYLDEFCYRLNRRR
jgi:transposase-like protein